MMNDRVVFIFSIILGAVILPQSVFAYIGPGAGISAIGTVLAFFGAILLAIVGFVWYPIKRLIARIKKRGKRDSEKNAS